MRPAWEIARREVLDHVATWKLPLALLLVALLLLTGVSSLASTHQAEVDAHDLVQDEYAAAGAESSPSALAHRFLGRPQPLALLVGGPAEELRSSVAGAPLVTNESARDRLDPLRLRFSPADLGTVGVGVLSLVAILVSYDAVAGEKERGTLKLLLLNPLTRRDVLLGKYLGAMFTLVAPLLVALAASLVALRLSGVRFGPDDAFRLLVLLGVLVLFLSCFVLIAIAASALTLRASVSILALGLAWLVLVAGAGSLAAFAATVEPERGADDVLRELRVLHASYDEDEARVLAEIRALEQKNATQGGALSPDEEARLRGLREDLRELQARRADDEWRVLTAYVRGREKDLQQAERLAALSPAEAYRSAAQKLARTDYDAARARFDEFSAYLREIEDLRREREAEAGPNATFEAPPFRNAPVSLGGDAARAMPFLVALGLQNLLAGSLAAVAFSRYDVR